MLDKRVIVIAGPNGAGKSTFAREFLPNEAGCSVFVNADLIAAGLSPFAPEKAAIRAGRLMLEEIHRHAAAGESFAFETTLSGRGYAHLLPAWQAAGYAVHLVFLRLQSAGTGHRARGGAGGAGRARHSSRGDSPPFRQGRAQFSDGLSPAGG